MNSARAGDGESGTRSLKTAATVLRALRLLGDHPGGLFPADIALHLGKSPSTARYMVNTLCEAGYAQRAPDGRCRLAGSPPWGAWGASQDMADLSSTDAAALGPGDPAPGSLLSEAVTDLYRATRQRTYLVRRSGNVVATISDTRGHQGLARVPGLTDHVAPEAAHALGLTKVLLAACPSYLQAVESEVLTARTERTVTSVEALRRELEEARRRGWAADDGEFADGFATVAAPVTSPSGTSTVAIGLSCSSRRYTTDGPTLVEAVTQVAAAAQQAWVDAIAAPTVVWPTTGWSVPPAPRDGTGRAPDPDPDPGDRPAVSGRGR